MNAMAPRFGTEPHGLNAPAMPLPAPVPGGRAAWPGVAAPRRWPSWLLLALVAVGLTPLGIGWVVVGGRHGEHPESVWDDHQGAANGVVEGASRERPMMAEQAGALKAVQVQVNQEVPIGALLFELSNDSQHAQVALAEAELAAAQAQLQHAAADYQRHQELVRQHAVSKADYEIQLYRRLTNQARVQEAEARLKLARAELAKTQVRAPVAGRILQIHKESGMQVGPAGRDGAAGPVLRLADVSQRRVRAFVEELDAGRVRVGQAAVVTADGFPGQRYAGRVVELAGRMGKDAPESDAPGEYKDVYFREVVIALDGGHELPLNLRVQVKIALVER